MMYQLPRDMMNRIDNVVRATGSPCSHKAFSPYGFSTLAVIGPLPAAGRFAGMAAGVVLTGGVAAGAGAAAGAGVVDGAVCAFTHVIPAQTKIAVTHAAALNLCTNMATVPLHWILEEGRDSASWAEQHNA